MLIHTNHVHVIALTGQGNEHAHLFISSNEPITPDFIQGRLNQIGYNTGEVEALDKGEFVAHLEGGITLYPIHSAFVNGAQVTAFSEEKLEQLSQLTHLFLNLFVSSQH